VGPQKAARLQSVRCRALHRSARPTLRAVIAERTAESLLCFVFARHRQRPALKAHAKGAP